MDKRIEQLLVLGGGFVLGFVAGGVYTLHKTKRRLEDEYAELAFQDIENVKEHYRKLYKEGEYADPTTLATARGLIADEGYDSASDEDLLEMPADKVEELIKGLDSGEVKAVITEARLIDVSLEAGGLGTIEVIGEVVEGRNNLFDKHNEEREALRAQDKPYVISNEEFGEEPHWDTINLSYFVEDDVLLDSDEHPIDNVERLVGKANLERFGAYEGEDPNILFIRNEAMRTDFEIAKEEGSYSKTILGIDPEPPRRRPRTRPRPSDDDE